MRSLVPDGASVASAVSAIVADVKAAGDAAVLSYTKLHDTRGAEPLGLRVSEQELATAHAQIDPAVAAGIELALANVWRRVASAGGPSAMSLVDFPTTPWSHPRGTGRKGAPPFTYRAAALHTRAQSLWGLPRLGPRASRTSPCARLQMGPDGNINPVILGACVLAGADEVYRMGGAHAIAALAYGTETANAVDVIVGPGNLFVQEAKRQSSGRIGIDSFCRAQRPTGDRRRRLSALSRLRST